MSDKDHTFKVWIEIEELDKHGDSVEVDHNLGGSLREFDTLQEAQNFVAEVEGKFGETEENAA